jgi:hypothetical protein
MPKLEISPSELDVQLSIGEKIAAIHGNLRVPLSGISGAEVRTGRWWMGLGLRIPGTAIPGLIIAGTYLWRKDHAFVCWKRGEQVLQVNLTGQRYSRLVIGVDDAETWAETVNAYLAGC